MLSRLPLNPIWFPVDDKYGELFEGIVSGGEGRDAAEAGPSDDYGDVRRYVPFLCLQSFQVVVLLNRFYTRWAHGSVP